MSLTEDSHLALVYDEQVPPHLLDEFYHDLEAKSLVVQRQAVPSRGVYLSVDEWLPTAVFLYLAKSYFDPFLKQAGSDHYVYLKKALKKLWNRLFDKDSTHRFMVVSSEGEAKLEHSPFFSIYAALNNERMVKFLIRDGCSEDEFADGCEAFLKLLVSYHSDTPCRDIEIDLDGEADNFRHVLIEFEMKTGSLSVVDPIRRSKNRRKT